MVRLGLSLQGPRNVTDRKTHFLFIVLAVCLASFPISPSHSIALFSFTTQTHLPVSPESLAFYIGEK